MTRPPDASRSRPETPAKGSCDGPAHKAPERQAIPGLAVLLTVAALAAGIALVAGPGHPRRPAAVVFALACCLPGAVVGWTLARLPTTDPARAVAGPLAAVTLRIMPPLAALGWLSSGGQSLREAGAGGLLVAFYLTLLATDLLLHVLAREPGARDSKAPH